MSDQSIPINIIDEYSDPVGRESEYNICIKYPDNVSETILSRGSELNLGFPLTRVDELSAVVQIESQIARSKSTHCYDPDLRCAFDLAVLDMLPVAMNSEGLSFSSFDIEKNKLKIIILKKARCDSYKGIAEHIHDNKELINNIGIDSIPKGNTVWNWDDQLETSQTPLNSVITRLVHAAYRNGVTTPKDAKSHFGLGNSDRININELTQDIENRALMNWIDEILNMVSEPITFDRAQNKSYGVKEIIGACALASLINSPSSAPVFGSWIFNSDNIIGDHLYELIAKLDAYEINEIFTEINYNIIKYASGIGFLNDHQNIALDTTWVNWDSKDNNSDNLTIENPERCYSGRGWCFAALGLTSPGSRFTFGFDLVSDKSKNVDIFRRQLRRLSDAGVEINRLHADREFYSGDAVKMFRAVANKNYAIRVKLNNEGCPPEKVASMNLSPGEARIETDVKFSGVSPKPNVCGQRVPKNSNKDIEYMGFLTDLSENDVQPGSIYQTYNQRWSIEAFFHQLKNGMSTNTKSPNPLNRLFLLNMGTVFHNIHVLINNARSPKYGFCPDVHYYQILTAIAFSVFEPQISSRLK